MSVVSFLPIILLIASAICLTVGLILKKQPNKKQTGKQLIIASIALAVATLLCFAISMGSLSQTNLSELNSLLN